VSPKKDKRRAGTCTTCSVYSISTAHWVTLQCYFDTKMYIN